MNSEHSAVSNNRFVVRWGRPQNYLWRIPTSPPHPCFPHLQSSALGDDDLFDIACAACETRCTACRLEGDLPICTEQLENTISGGGDVTLETLSLQSGYWRATNTSRVVLPCYHPGACAGGISGLSSSCAKGYGGPCESSRVFC